MTYQPYTPHTENFLEGYPDEQKSMWLAMLASWRNQCALNVAKDPVPPSGRRFVTWEMQRIKKFYTSMPIEHLVISIDRSVEDIEFMARRLGLVRPAPEAARGPLQS